MEYVHNLAGELFYKKMIYHFSVLGVQLKSQPFFKMPRLKDVSSRSVIAMLILTVIALGMVFLEVILFIQALPGTL